MCNKNQFPGETEKRRAEVKQAIQKNRNKNKRSYNLPRRSARKNKSVDSVVIR